jgi:transcriptional regulator with XRE-family HTH domain
VPFYLEPELLRVLVPRHTRECNRYVPDARRAPDAYDACMTSGTLIRQARTRAGLSQGELAERSGKDRAQIARWERDAVTPSLETLRELLRACGFDLDLSLVPYRGPDVQLEARLEKALGRTPQERLQTMLKAHRR